MQSTDPPALGKSTNLLCMPKRGKIPPKLDRMKLFAASALAAKVGYASTRNVKTPEKTRIVLCATREHVSILRIQNIPNAGGRPVRNLPGAKKSTANDGRDPVHIGVDSPGEDEETGSYQGPAQDR
jgi:hypothetical protein